MQFTFDQIRQAERTLDRMANAALTLTDTDEQKRNIHAIQYLIGELRMTAQALETPETDKAQAVDRLLSVFANQSQVKAMKYQAIPHTIGEQFATYVAYGDFEHLSDEEKRQFDDLHEALDILAPDGYHFAHWDITDQRDEFALCEATDLMGACLTFNAVYFQK